MSNGTVAAGSSDALNKYHDRIQHLIDEDLFELPMLPQVASQVISMSSNPQASLEELAALIHKDQVLAGHVLRIANSAAFCSGDPVVSLSQALARLGMSITGEIAISASLKNGIFNAPGCEDVIQNLWAHALASATIGKEIARAKRYNVEGQYLCSLLHAIGKPVVLHMVVKVKQELGGEIAKDAVLAIVNKYHVPVGVKVAAQWKLPQTVGCAIEYYLQYAQASQFKQEAMMTNLSHQMASWLLQAEAISDETLKKNPIFTELNFYPSDVEVLMERKAQFLETVNAMAL